MQLFRWQNGRQGTGYRIFPLIQCGFPPFDCYLIHYPIGSEIPPHRDPNTGGKHYRINIELIRGTGGEFKSERNILSFWRFHLFRPDISTHQVSRVTAGKRVVLSLGWLKK